MGDVKRNQLRHVDTLDVALCDVKNVQRFLGVFKRYISGYIDKGNFELGDIIIDFNEVYTRVCRESTDKYVRTIELFCEGYNLREIGERLGITAQAVHQVVKAFSKKVAKVFQAQLGLS